MLDWDTCNQEIMIHSNLRCFPGLLERGEVINLLLSLVLYTMLLRPGRPINAAMDSLKEKRLPCLIISFSSVSRLHPDMLRNTWFHKTYTIGPAESGLFSTGHMSPYVPIQRGRESEFLNHAQEQNSAKPVCSKSHIVLTTNYFMFEVCITPTVILDSGPAFYQPVVHVCFHWWQPWTQSWRQVVYIYYYRVVVYIYYYRVSVKCNILQ